MILIWHQSDTYYSYIILILFQLQWGSTLLWCQTFLPPSRTLLVVHCLLTQTSNSALLTQPFLIFKTLTSITVTHIISSPLHSYSPFLPLRSLLVMLYTYVYCLCIVIFAYPNILITLTLAYRFFVQEKLLI